ncbi:unnamed protein product, partial [Prorocentrum cordatum]
MFSQFALSSRSHWISTPTQMELATMRKPMTASKTFSLPCRCTSFHDTRRAQPMGPDSADGSNTEGVEFETCTCSETCTCFSLSSATSYQSAASARGSSPCCRASRAEASCSSDRHAEPFAEERQTEPSRAWLLLPGPDGRLGTEAEVRTRCTAMLGSGLRCAPAASSSGTAMRKARLGGAGGVAVRAGWAARRDGLGETAVRAGQGQAALRPHSARRARRRALRSSRGSPQCF